MECKINGEIHAFEAASGLSAAQLVREQLRLTGTKTVCGQGVCGACTVLLDGVPVLSCLLAADQLNGKSVTTVEAFSDDTLHPVQKSFMANDALQCGYCTPGFVMRGIAFYEKWKAEKQSGMPDREALKAAFSGNLCRCGAYEGLLRAMEEACLGKFDSPEFVFDYPRVEAQEKVTGAALFTSDVSLPRQMTGIIIRSTLPHARILNCDLEAARAFPGVGAVIALYDPEDPILRYVGQEICALAATNKAVAKQAAALIQPKLEALPFVTDPFEAASVKSPEIYSGKSARKVPNAAEGVIFPGKWKHNTRKHIVNLLSVKPIQAYFRLKRAAKGKHRSLVRETFTTAAQIHTPLEPHCCVAHWEGEYKLRVFLSTQACHWSAREIARLFKLKSENVKVTANHVGGGFGSKLDLETEAIAAIKLAKIAGNPVKVALSRAEEMLVGGYRPPTRISLSLAGDQNKKKLKALSVKAETFSGVGISSLVGSMFRLIYPGMPKIIEELDVVSNLSSAKPFRGPSAPQASWAMEQAVDAMALQLGMNPLEARMRWDLNKIRHNLFLEVEKLELWQERKETGTASGRFRTGIGMASGNWFNFFHPKTKVKVALSAKGISVTTATQDMGTGSRSVLAVTVGAIFGVSPAAVKVYIGNSNSVQGPTSGGSRTTNSLYITAKEAAMEVKEMLGQHIREKFGTAIDSFTEGGIQTDDGFHSWQDLFVKIPALSATATRGHNAPLNILSHLPLGADDVAMGPSNLGSVFVVQVQVDTLLGKVKVEKVWGGIASGKIIVPELAKSQCYGGIIQGISYALYEERIVDHKLGKPMNTNLEDYHIAGIGDMPEIELFFHEGGFESHKGGAAGLGEISTIPVAAAVGNAVFNATGSMPVDLPLTVSRISSLLSR